MVGIENSFYYTYVLYSEKDNKNYIGYTHNLFLRFEQHKKGKVPSTKNRRPLKLIYFEACSVKRAGFFIPLLSSPLVFVMSSIF